MADLSAPARLEEAFERIESSILPCMAAMLESLLDAAAGRPGSDPASLSRQLRSAATELEELTQAVQRTGPKLANAEAFRTAVA